MQSFASFNAPMLVIPHPFATAELKKKYWVVSEPFSYYLDDKGSHVLVPKGFLTDGASVPKIFHRMLPPWGEYGQCAIVHDYLCETGRYYVRNSKGQFDIQTINRKQADEIFFEAMRRIGVPSNKRKYIETAVKLYRVVSKPSCPNFNQPKRIIEREIRRRLQNEESFIW